MNDMPRIQPAAIVKTIEVKASPERAFEIFARRMGDWWHKDHSIAAGTTQKDVIVEPNPGGRWYELGADGSEHQWGHVIDYDPPRRLLLAWQLNRDFVFDPGLDHRGRSAVRAYGRGHSGPLPAPPPRAHG
jgi:uncharacterized protein YndB with AHSA1/START domain